MKTGIDAMGYAVNKIREDFPAINQKIRGKPPVYFDNACMTLRPRQVVEAMNQYYTLHPSCHKRAIHYFGEMTTREYDKARGTVRDYIGARESKEIIFTKNATEAINIVAGSFPFEKGDIVLTTDMEHNSNFLPWQVICKQKKIEHKIFPLSPEASFDLEKFRSALTSGVKLVCVFHKSHITGYTLPVDEIVQLAHQHGAFVLLDGAQSAPHQNIDVRKLDADFFAFSFHKMLGPTGMGCLYGKKILLERMEPVFMGGEAVDDVDYHSFVPAGIPDRFEAGLQNYAGAMGVTAAIKYLENIGMARIQQHISRISEFIAHEIRNIPKVDVLGPEGSALSSGIINFHIHGMDSGELSILLDQTGNIMTRSGVHCCHAWYKKNKMPPTLRASLYLYNTMEEAQVFVEVLRKIAKYL